MLAETPCDLERALAAVDRLREPALHLEREVRDEHERHEQPPLTRRPGDPDSALGVPDRIVVALEVRLGPAEVEERLEARRELRVRQPIDLGPGLVPMRIRRRDASGDRLAETQRRGGGGNEGAVAAGLRGLQRALTHLDGQLEVELVQPVDGQLDLQRRRCRRTLVRQIVPRADEPMVGLPVTPEPVLDRCAPARSARRGDRRPPAAVDRSPRAAPRGTGRARRRTATPRRATRGRRHGVDRPRPATGAMPPRTSERPRRGRARRPPSRPRAEPRSPPRRPARPIARRGGPAAGAMHRVRRAPPRHVRERRAASRPGSPRRRRVAGADGGRRTGAAPASCARDRARGARRARRAPPTPRARRSPPRDRARTALPPRLPPRAACARAARAMRAPRRTMPRRPPAHRVRRARRRHCRAPSSSVRHPRPGRAARGRTGCRRHDGRSPRSTADRGRRGAPSPRAR